MNCNSFRNDSRKLQFDSTVDYGYKQLFVAIAIYWTMDFFFIDTYFSYKNEDIIFVEQILPKR